MTRRFQFNTVGLFTRDNRSTVDFYTKTFGFTTDWDGVQPNVEMMLGDMRIILFPREAFEQMVSQSFQYPDGLNGTMELAFDVPTFADVDKEYRNALDNGAQSVLPPTTEPWGQRTCYIADPDGNLIEIGSFTEQMLYQATIEEYDSIIAFYDDVIERTPDVRKYARWLKGKHPTADGIRAYIEEGSMYLYKEQGTIVGAMAVTMYQGEDYHAIEWSRQVPDNEVAVIHILAVSPDRQGTGIGSKMVREAIELAKAKCMKAIRLDALATNTPAHKLYQRLGFEYRGKQNLYAENTGWTDFFFFEYK